MNVLPTHTERFLAATSPEHTPTQSAMADHADELGFPIVGPEAGGVLRLLARLTNAERVFEFGSGFGYSASWFLRGGADHVVCTEFDVDEAKAGIDFMEQAGYEDRVTYEVGDAMETIHEYEGPFDIVLVDHQKRRYVDAYETIAGKLRPGGIVVADNIMQGPIDFDSLLAYFERGVEIPGDDEETRGIAAYVDAVCGDESLETIVLPVGEGITVSTLVA